MDSMPTGATNHTVHEVEVKVEYPEIDVEEDNRNSYTSIEHIKRIPGHTVLHEPVYNLWTSKATTCLITQYKKYRSMVGQSTQFRSLRDMFDIISAEMQKYGYFFSPQKCENKWRVLERKYKNLVMREMLKKPGRMKHYGHWEHKKALDEIFNEKRKSVYLQESEYPPTGNSTKYALILPKPISVQNNSQLSIENSKNNIEKAKHTVQVETSNSLATASNVLLTSKVLESAEESVAVSLEKLIQNLTNHLEQAEKNNEKRHLENIELRQRELNVQERLLKIKEQKLELEKRKILAMAQNVQLIYNNEL